MEYCTLEHAQEIVELKYATALNLSAFAGKIIYPTIEWKSLGVYRAGYTEYLKNKVTLNKDYLHSPDWHAFLEDTPLHELAHLIAFVLYHSTGHDDAWKIVCYRLGLSGNRCHNFAAPEDIHIRKQQRYTMYCKCRQHNVSACIYNRIKNNTVYYCKYCNKPLQSVPYTV